MNLIIHVDENDRPSQSESANGLIYKYVIKDFHFLDSIFNKYFV